MIINGKERFLIKGKNDGNKTATKDLYDIYGENIDNYHDAALLHQEIMTKYPPAEVIRMCNPAMLELKLSTWEIERYYLHYMTKIVGYLYDNELYFAGVHWAKKGLDLFELFCTKLTPDKLAELKTDCIEYQTLLSQFKERMDYFDVTFYTPSDENEGVVFYWEKDYTPSAFPNNDN